MTDNALAEDTPQEAPEAPEQPESPENAAPETPEAPETEAAPEQPEQPEKSAAEERIRRLVAERNAAMDYGRYWQGMATKNKQPEPEAPKEQPAPTLEQFDGNTDKWAKAYSEWNDKRTESVAQRKAEEHYKSVSAEAAKRDAARAWNEKLTTFSAKHPDAPEVIGNPTLAITDPMRDVILSSDKGAEIAYHLGNNPTEAARISLLSPTLQAAALGRIEAALDRPAPKPTPSRAPAPPTPIRGGGAPSVDLENMSIDEYLKHRLERRRKA